jgi:adenylylsulfate kinase
MSDYSRNGMPGGMMVWFTGLSGSGKSTLAQAVFSQLANRGHRAEILDGDIVRAHLCKGLGFSREDRIENIRRIACVSARYRSVSRDSCGSSE